MGSTIKTRKNRLLSFVCTLVMLLGIGGFFGIRSMNANAAIREYTFNCGPSKRTISMIVPTGTASAESTNSFVKAYKSSGGYNVYVSADTSAATTKRRVRTATVYYRDYMGKLVKKYTVNQAQNYLNTTTKSGSLNKTTNSTNYVQIKLDYNCKYKITCDSFLTVKTVAGKEVTTGGSDTGFNNTASQTLRIYPKSENTTGSYRKGYIKIRAEGSSSDTIKIPITQYAS